MSAILITHTGESSEGDRTRQTHKLMLICSDVARKLLQKIHNFHIVYQPKRILHAANILCKDGKDNIADFNLYI